MTTLRLVIADAGEAIHLLKNHLPPHVKFPLLSSFYYLKGLHSAWKFNPHFIRDWVLDSGAFSAHNSGKPIDLAEYIEACHGLLASAGHKGMLVGCVPPVEIYALDVIGDWRAGMRNLHKQWQAGLEVIPCYHVGEPWAVLEGYAKDYPKIALGGMADMVGLKKLRWAEQCFARVWPKKIHGFAAVSESIQQTVPFHSVDSTSWVLGPTAFGNWKTLGGHVDGMRNLIKNKGTAALRGELEHFMRQGDRSAARWHREMAMLDALPLVRPPMGEDEDDESL